MSVLTDLRNRGVRDVFFVVCDGLKGLPEVVEQAWPQAIVQTCIVRSRSARPSGWPPGGTGTRSSAISSRSIPR